MKRRSWLKSIGYIALAIFFLALASFALASCESASAQSGQVLKSPSQGYPAGSLAHSIDAYIDSAYGNFSGTVLVAKEGSVVLEQGYGFADRDLKLLNSPITKFDIGSITKSFTAMAIIMLKEQGLVRLEESICAYLKEAPPEWKPITIRQLLTHSSGIHNYTELPAKVLQDFDLMGRYTPEKILPLISGLPLDFAPGTSWHYSNSGYFLLGMIVERLSGMKYEDFLRERILTPLGMKDSGFIHDDSILSDYAKGYSEEKGTRRIVDAQGFDGSVFFSAGGLYSTVGDLFKWDQAFYENALISEESLHAILTDLVPMGTGASYGYGWMVFDQLGHHCLFHTGGVPGFNSVIFRYPDDRLTVVILSNQDFSYPLQMGLELANIALTGK